MSKSARTLAAPVLTALCAFALVLTPTLAQSVAFLEAFDEGTPAAPLPYSNPQSWDIYVQGFDSTLAAQGIPSMRAQHGPGCEPPGFPYTSVNSHLLRTQADTVFVCNNHVMTAPGLAGYAAIYLTPPAVMDFSAGESVLRWDMSTLRTSARDWVDLVITPPGERSSLAFNNNDQHIPPDNIHIQLVGGGNVFFVYQRAGGPLQYDGGAADVQLPGDTSTSWDDVFRGAGLEQSPSRRDAFEVRLSRTHISLCMPGYHRPGQTSGAFCWVNAPLRVPLDPQVWHDQAIVEFGHRVYNAEKACIDDASGHNAYGDEHCPPDTWHWDNVSIQPHVAFDLITSDPPGLELHTASPSRVHFRAPAPAGAMLSFAQFSHTPDLRVSYDGGSTWVAPRIQPSFAPNNGASEENGEAVFTPIPAGTQDVMVRGSNGFWGGFGAENFAIYGAPGGRPRPPTPTVSTPVATASATAVATATPTRTPAVAATPTLTPTVTVTSLATTTPTVMAPPTGLHVEGNRLVDNGVTAQLRGVNRSGTEYMCSGSAADSFDGPSDQASITAIKAWGANVVRVPLNEGCWLGLNGIPQAMTAAKYRQQITDYVNLLTSNGLYAIVDLHWSAPGTAQSLSQREMSDMDHSPAFWSSVARMFAGNNRVLFDLHNEPHDIEWSCLRDGGTCAGLDYQAAGMQTLLNAVRTTGATNVVLVAGNGWAGDMSRWLEFRPVDPLNNTAASWHQYNFGGCTAAQCWDADLAPVLAQVPLVAGEIGENDCQHGFVDGVMAWLDSHGASYLAWSWSTYDCSGFPSLISSYSGTPTAYGDGVRVHLQSFGPPTATPVVPPTVTPSPTATPMSTSTPAPAAACEVNVRINGVERGWVPC